MEDKKTQIEKYGAPIPTFSLIDKNHIFINLFFSGNFTSKKIPVDQLLESYRKTTIDELKERYINLKNLAQNSLEKIIFFEEIRSKFNSVDIFKMWTLTGMSIFSGEEFDRVYTENPKIAKDFYVNCCCRYNYKSGIIKIPYLEKYGEIFKLRLYAKWVINAINSADIDYLKLCLKFYNGTELFLRGSDLGIGPLYGKINETKLIEMFQLILDMGYEITTKNDFIVGYIDKCTKPKKIEIKSARKTDEY